jgi:hypothetical protein
LLFVEIQQDSLGLEDFGPQSANTAFGANNEWKGESVPVFVSVRSVSRGGFKGTAVEAIVGGNVGAVGADRDPGVGGGIITDTRAIAVRRGHRRCYGEVRRQREMRTIFAREEGGVSRGLIWFRIVAADYHESEREIGAIFSSYGECPSR